MEIKFYQVEIKIPSPFQEDFLKWLKKHMVEMLALPTFIEAKLLQVLDLDPKSDVVIFQARYIFEKSEDFDRYLKEFAPIMRKDLPDEYREVASFQRSLGSQSAL